MNNNPYPTFNLDYARAGAWEQFCRDHKNLGAVSLKDVFDYAFNAGANSMNVVTDK